MGAGSLWLDLFCSHPHSPTTPKYLYLSSYAAAAVASSSSIKTHDASFLHHQTQDVSFLHHQTQDVLGSECGQKLCADTFSYFNRWFQELHLGV
jgi:hypothetical protein